MEGWACIGHRAVLGRSRHAGLRIGVSVTILMRGRRNSIAITRLGFLARTWRLFLCLDIHRGIGHDSSRTHVARRRRWRGTQQSRVLCMRGSHLLRRSSKVVVVVGVVVIPNALGSGKLRRLVRRHSDNCFGLKNRQPG